ncbi:hypothetical protein DFH07DRAFT_763788 [Mycena maculata]|uniref:Uncharacterized protein n=1 Tax=Mycena maculata TaxID=230809 RepID=A0AAD7KGM5_9AGAR|nr:hypothetical protein DFH07DRAFT_763788 [Mycena maculata]
MFPRLPPELEREIFELAIFLHLDTMPALLLVARRVYTWLKPLLYQVVALYTPADDPPPEDESVPMSTVFQGRLYTFFKLMESKPASFFHEHVLSTALVGSPWWGGCIMEASMFNISQKNWDSEIPAMAGNQVVRKLRGHCLRQIWSPIEQKPVQIMRQFIVQRRMSIYRIGGLHAFSSWGKLGKMAFKALRGGCSMAVHEQNWGWRPPRLRAQVIGVHAALQKMGQRSQRDLSRTARMPPLKIQPTAGWYMQCDKGSFASVVEEGSGNRSRSALGITVIEHTVNQ